MAWEVSFSVVRSTLIRRLWERGKFRQITEVHLEILKNFCIVIC